MKIRELMGDIERQLRAKGPQLSQELRTTFMVASAERWKCAIGCMVVDGRIATVDLGKGGLALLIPGDTRPLPESMDVLINRTIYGRLVKRTVYGRTMVAA
jgi:hypothetical protein